MVATAATVAAMIHFLLLVARPSFSCEWEREGEPGRTLQRAGGAAVGFGAAAARVECWGWRRQRPPRLLQHAAALLMLVTLGGGPRGGLSRPAGRTWAAQAPSWAHRC